VNNTNINIAQAYFQAVQQGDMPGLGEILDEDLVWHQPGPNQFSGEHKGRDAVFGMLGRMMQVSGGSFAIDQVTSLMNNGDLVAATIHFTGERDGGSMSMDGVDVLHIKGGKIVEVWLFSSDQSAEDEFWGS
jgi:ketosteroid isomerase-like protein